MSELREYQYRIARMLPVILLLDTSGSMEDNNKIRIMNRAVKDMLESFKNTYTSAASICVSIITFGGASAQMFLNMTEMEEMDLSALKDMEANGGTPMGDALDMAKKMIEDKNQIPSNASRPTVILISDGMPNDRWEEPLQRFKTEGRSSKCDRMAMGIGVRKGTDASRVLELFTEDKEKIFCAEDASEISKFFRYVTMSTTVRATGGGQGAVPSIRDFMGDTGSVFAVKEDDDFDF